MIDTDEFLDDFYERLLWLKTQHFISKEQSSFFKNLKGNLLSGERYKAHCGTTLLFLLKMKNFNSKCKKS